MNPDRDKIQPGWYYRLSQFFKERFGKPVYKIPLDAGFSCPNRDGTVGTGGCSYCYNPSFSPFSGKKTLSVREQILKGKKKSRNALYLAYFQAYTNTYAPVGELKVLYDQALSDDEVAGLSIATRPDCISAEIIDLLEVYAARCHTWIEYGLQSAHDQTLKRINRGHGSAAFTKAMELTTSRGIFICAHIILGLPGETKEMILATIDFLNKCKIDGIKFHHLQIIRGTPLASDYEEGSIEVFDQPEHYIDLLCDCLERLSPACVIHRLASQASSKVLLTAPRWPVSSGQLASMVESELKKRGTYQGALFKNS
jgi:hypothetical protein